MSNSEEYAVIAAVLFPAPLPGHQARLSGVSSRHYRLFHQTIQINSPGSGGDAAMVDDFNRKNAEPHSLDEEKLRQAILRGDSVALVAEGATLRGASTGINAGTTYISRPGFNADRSRAMIQINHVADPEMGVGYSVILEALPEKGVWTIVRADLNRTY